MNYKRQDHVDCAWPRRPCPGGKGRQRVSRVSSWTGRWVGQQVSPPPQAQRLLRPAPRRPFPMPRVPLSFTPLPPPPAPSSEGSRDGVSQRGSGRREREAGDPRALPDSPPPRLLPLTPSRPSLSVSLRCLNTGRLALSSVRVLS